MAAKRSKRAAPKLYWCTTPDHDEDWFIVARSAAGAAALHEEAEGYDSGDADAEFVCSLPQGFRNAPHGWPSKELLDACGMELLSEPRGPRVVKVAGRVLAEGDVFANVAARLGLVTRH
jgi:hypothetical protein